MLDENGNIIVEEVKVVEKPTDAPADDKMVNIDDVDYNLDDKGNALDSEGKVFKTVEEIAKLNDTIPDTSDEPEIEVDSVKYKLNKTGDAIDTEGNIKFTKDELSKLNAVSDNKDGDLDMSEIIKVGNIKPMNDKGEFNEYENTTEGLTNYISDVQDEGIKQGRTNYADELVTKYPIVTRILNHLELNNGDFEGFSDKVSYKDVKIDDKNEDQGKSIIFAARKARGEDNVKIEKYYNYLKDSDGLKDEVKTELEYLQKSENDRDKQEEDAVVNKRAQDITNSNNYWGVAVNDKGEMSKLNVDNSIYDIIVNKKSIKVDDKTYKIPEKIRVTDNGKVSYYTPDQFFMYLYEPVPIKGKDNQTHYVTRDEIKINNENSKRTNGHSVLEAFRRLVNYDDSQFITEQINSAKIKGFSNKTVRRYTTGKSDKKQGSTVKII